MKTNTSRILVALFAFVASSSGRELIELAAEMQAAGPEVREMPYVNGEKEEIIKVSKFSIVKTEDVESVSIGGDPLVATVVLSAEGRKKMVKGTTDMKGKRLAVIINGRINMLPMLNDAPLGGEFVITGFKDPADAKAFGDKFNKKK